MKQLGHAPTAHTFATLWPRRITARRLGLRACLPFAIALTAACSGGSGSSTDATPQDSAGGGDVLKATWGPIEVAPSQEDTRCITMKLTNTTAVKINKMVNTLTAGSHHLIVYRDNSATAEALTPTPCTPFAGTLRASTNGTAPIMITQKRNDTLALPAGVAYTFAPGQFVRLEMHFINVTDQPQMIGATTEFHTAAPNSIQHEADFLFMGTPDINLAPGATSTVRRFLTMRQAFSGANIFAITGHTHKFGTDMQVGYAAQNGGPVTSVYKPMPFSWDEPETTMATPPFQVPANGGFDFQCTYRNTSNQTVMFGESATEEMCFFWAYYYPSKGAHVCLVTEQGGGAPFTVCCPDDGEAICSRLLGSL